MGRASSAITVPLQGGLGNQLFQLAAGLAVASRTNRRVLFSDYWLRHPASCETPRDLALQGILGPDELTTIAAPRTGRLTDRLTRRHAVERDATDDVLARVGIRTRVVAGYFHRLAYAQEAWPLLRTRLLTSSLSQHRALITAKPQPYGALHYRLGDYATNETANRSHGVTSPEYFAQVIRDGRIAGVTEWMVVSDDTSTAFELLGSVDLPPDVRLLAPDSGDEWGDMTLLSAARICAISNSSFSWWSAFIGTAERRPHVIAPRPWTSDEEALEPPMFPDQWERHDRTLIDMSLIAP